MTVTDQKRNTRRKTCPSATLSTKNLSHDRDQNVTRAFLVRRRRVTAEPWHGHFEIE